MILARMSNYWPPDGPPNCWTPQWLNGYCYAKMKSGQTWESWVNGQNGVYALACPEEYAFGTVFVLPGGEVFQCWDRGGKIKTVDGIPWLDLMVRTPPVDYGTVIAITVYQSLGDSNVPLTAAWPYAEFWFTQGLHGASYGHQAVDIKAGAMQPLRSPITGRVVANGYYKTNTELVIESDRYRVTLWHGNFTPAVGQMVYLGNPIGTEGNSGYVTDGNGVLCQGRAGCGYHTHINIFDKIAGVNVDPRDVLVEWSN